MKTKTKHPGPIILKLVKPPPEPPKPRMKSWFTVVVGGRVVQVIYERWLTKDAQAAPYAMIADQLHPGESFVVRAFDLDTHAVLPPASDDEITAQLQRLRSGY